MSIVAMVNTHCYASPVSDMQLLAAIGTADRRAFEELFRRYAPKLLSFYVRKTRSRSEAEDLVQDAMLRVWSHAHAYRDELGAPSTWIYAIARNRLIDVRRKAQRLQRDATRLHEEQTQPHVEEDLSRHQLAEQVLLALDALPSACAQVVLASYFGHESGTQISSRLEIPLGTVKSRLATGLSQLKRQLRQKQALCFRDSSESD